jgi:Rrf2 family protein
VQQSSRLAIYALIELAANPGRQLSAVEIGEKYRVSSHHLAKVLMTLGRAGLVQATRGVGGGYSFTGNAKRLTLLEIISLFEDTSTGCKLADPSKATSEEWALFDISCEISEISMATYGSITIATMLKQIARRNRAEAAKGQAEARG